MALGDARTASKKAQPMIANIREVGKSTELAPLGEILVPDRSLHGAQTERACRNFQLTGSPVSSMPELVVALAQVKKAAAITNAAIGELDATRAGAIIRACDGTITASHHYHFSSHVA